MQPDSELLAEVRAWLAKADSDLRVGDYLLLAIPPFTGDAVFHAQQATEKMMKALLTWHNTIFRRTHDLAEIGQQCIAIDPSLATLCRRAEGLSAFAWVFRYPGDPEEPSLEETRAALALAKEVYDAVLQRLPPEVWP